MVIISSFKNISGRSNSELAKFVWLLKDKGKQFNIKWSIISKEFLYNIGTKKCNLCLREKVEIMRHIRSVGTRLINKREEVFSKCVHRMRYFLGNVDPYLRTVNNEQQTEAKSNQQLPFHEQDYVEYSSSNIPILNASAEYRSTRSGRRWRCDTKPA